MISNEKYFLTVGLSEWGRWQVRKASVEDPYSYSLIEDLGPVLNAAYIESDGNFHMESGTEHFSMDSDRVPWIAVITETGKLYVKQLCANLDTAILIDTDVVQASLCRGWRSDEWDVDAGLILGWVKNNGNAYIREYGMVNSELIWRELQQISSGSTQIQVIRLNDYRMGVFVQPQNIIYVSERYYIGGTAKTEFVDITLRDDFHVESFLMVSEPDAAFEIISAVASEDGMSVIVTANFPFYNFDANWFNIECTSSGFSIISYEIQEGLLILHLNKKRAGKLKFHIPFWNRIRFERTTQSRPVLPETTFEVIGAPIPVAEEEHISIDLSATFTSLVAKPKVELKQGYAESIEISLNGSFTALGNKPLEVEQYGYSETVEIDLTGTFATFHTQMVGDTPV